MSGEAQEFLWLSLIILIIEKYLLSIVISPYCFINSFFSESDNVVSVISFKSRINTLTCSPLRTNVISWYNVLPIKSLASFL